MRPGEITEDTLLAMGAQPAVGRIVHYVSHGTPHREDGTQAYASQCRAAIVTAVVDWDGQNPQHLHLSVFSPEGMFFPHAVPYDPSGGGGTWHWMEHGH